MCHLQDAFILDISFNISIKSSGLAQNILGQKQDVICSISVPPDVDPDTIELTWLNEDDIITDDSRVTINTSSNYHNDSTLVTIIQFDPLIKDDEGKYICYTIINGSLISDSISLFNFTGKLCIHQVQCRVPKITYYKRHLRFVVKYSAI